MKRFKSLDNMLNELYAHKDKENALEYKIMFGEDDSEGVVYVTKRWNEELQKWRYDLKEPGLPAFTYEENEIEWAVYDIEGISSLYFSDRTQFTVVKVTK